MHGIILDQIQILTASVLIQLIAFGKLILVYNKTGSIGKKHIGYLYAFLIGIVFQLALICGHFIRLDTFK